MTLTWQNGRQLATLSKAGLTASYTYNESGLRTSKTINGITTEYYWNGSQLLGQKTGNSSLYFLYDERGLLVGFNDGTKTYLYTRNLQGDIISITDTSNGNTVAQYTYDSWGNILTATGTIQIQTLSVTEGITTIVRTILLTEQILRRQCGEEHKSNKEIHSRLVEKRQGKWSVECV